MTIGLKNVVYCKVLDDVDGGVTTYGPVKPLIGAIDAQVVPQNADPNVQYADDGEFDVITPDADYDIDLETAGFTVADMAELQGHEIDANGGMILKQGDEPPYIAVGFKSEKSTKFGGGYRYVWIYKARPQMMSHTFHTKEGATITRQTGKMRLTGIKRLSDGFKQYITDTPPEGFLSAPYMPVRAKVISISAQPLDTAVTAGAITGNLAVTASASGGGTVAYKWYENDIRTMEGAVEVSGGNSAALPIPSGLTVGNHYFYCELTCTGAVDVFTDIVVVVVLSA